MLRWVLARFQLGAVVAIVVPGLALGADPGKGTKIDAAPAAYSQAAAAPATGAGDKSGAAQRASPPKSMAPDAGTPAAVLPPIQAPFGRIGDVLTPAASTVVANNELSVLATFPGCAEPQRVNWSRFLLLGVVDSAERAHRWLEANAAVQKRLFGKSAPLARAIDRARQSSFHEGIACDVQTKPSWKVTHLDLVSDGRLAARQAPPGICKLERGPAGQGGVWLFSLAREGKIRKKDFAAALSLAPARADSKSACLPRISGVLFDDAGTARFAYHADYGGALEVEVLGDRCERLVFRFDPSSQAFIPELDRDPACPAKPARR